MASQMMTMMRMGTVRKTEAKMISLERRGNDNEGENDNPEVNGGGGSEEEDEEDDEEDDEEEDDEDEDEELPQPPSKKRK